MERKIKKEIFDKRKVVKKISESKSKMEPVKAGFKKHYLKAGSICRVTFRLPKQAAPESHLVSIAGDFNSWNTNEILMRRLKSGDYKVTMQLPCHREYKFRYLIDGNRWENDWCADKYIPNPYGCDDSVVVV